MIKIASKVASKVAPKLGGRHSHVVSKSRDTQDGILKRHPTTLLTGAGRVEPSLSTVTSQSRANPSHERL